jgi:leader peptidase (prepilin peptidase)/N-methyltransferase
MVTLPPEPIASVAMVAIGLLLGSFLNVCIYRLPLGKSVVRPRSACPACGAPIAWYQNVPVLSWIALRGRCAACAASISWRYPLVELTSAAILLGLWTWLGPTAAFAVAGPYALALLVLFFTDYDHQLLPDAVTLSGVVAGLAASPVNPFLGEGAWHRLVLSGSGAFLGAAVLWSIGAVYSRLRGVDAMGLGDVKMMAMVGAVSGPLGVLFTLFAGSTAGAVVGLAMIPLRGKTLGDTLPFGCFLAPSALAALLVGRRAIEGYLNHVVRGAGGP